MAAAASLVVALGAAFVGGVSVGRAHRIDPSAVDQAIAAVQAHGNAPPSTADLEADAVRGVVGGLDDTWAAYYGVGSDPASQTQLRALLDGEYSGLGLWLRRSGTERGIGVASVVAGSPAATAGVQPGDQLLAVDGHDVSTQSADEVASSLTGRTGSTVQVLVRTPAGSDRSLRLVCSEVPADAVTTGTDRQGITTIRIAMFSAGVGAAVQRADAQAHAAHATGIVLDLRGDPGGLLSEAVAAASVFLDGGPVVSLSGRTVPEHTLDAARGGDTATPLAVLVDGGTASAAEILAGALQDRGRGVLVGSRTFGKGSVQQVVPLSDGSSFELTVATYRTPDGHAVDGVGIEPDVTVPASAAPSVAADRAVQLLEALAGAR